MKRTGPAASIALWLGVAPVIAGCGSHEPSRRAPRPARHLTVSADAGLGADDAAATTEQPAMLPGPLRACIARVQGATPPELAGALEAVEYTSAAEDGCRADMAPRTRDRSLCDGIALSAVRSICRERVAIARGEPDQCPPSLTDRGLDPVCLALAAHDAARCAAALPPDRVRCLAVARDDASHCSPLDPLLQPRCRRDVAALHGLVPRTNAAPARPGTVHLRIVPGVDPDAGGGREWDLDVGSRGVYLDPQGTIFLLDPMRGWPSPFVPTSEVPVLAIAIAQPSRPGHSHVAEARIVMPDGRFLEPSPALPASDAVMTFVTHERGGHVAGTVHATLFATGQPYTVDVVFDSFVRDIVSRETLE